jgi:hypothetical protein
VCSVMVISRCNAPDSKAGRRGGKGSCYRTCKAWGARV